MTFRVTQRRRFVFITISGLDLRSALTCLEAGRCRGYRMTLGVDVS